MTIDITSFFFNSNIEGATATCAWATSVGYKKTKACRIEDEKPGVLEILTGMLYKSIADKDSVGLSEGSPNREILLCSIFDKVYINNILLPEQSFIMTLVREHSKSHDNRLLVSYPKYAKLEDVPVNKNAIDAMAAALDCTSSGCWFVHDISIRNQNELHFSAIVVDKEQPKVYTEKSSNRSDEWNAMIVRDREYTLKELGDILKDMYNNAEPGKQVAMIYIFVFKYGQYLVDVYKSSEVVAAAELKASFFAEVDKAYNIYRYATKKQILLPGQVNKPENTLQNIYFGSPGTGKSFKIKNEVLSGVPDEFIFRTTFHPDTDYASFVGCYKPVCDKDDNTGAVYSIEDLAAIYAREVGPTEQLKKGHIEPRIAFGVEYCEYFGGRIADYNVNEMLALAGIEVGTDCKDDRVGATYVRYGVVVGKKLNPTKNTNTITYKFVPQTFTNAYVKAWQNPTEDVYLVIEEINRGNCAQIFGDLFQLLDRNDEGISEYPIKADADLEKYLIEILAEGNEGIEDGRLKLPANLHILATMNTSDQSLFPMDSAFKRRWEWKFIPTCVKSHKENIVKAKNTKETTLYRNDSEERTLSDGMYQYKWSEFLKNINECIEQATRSDDKKLGFWFVKTAKDNFNISIDTFVSKVIFYLWNDIFKDFGNKPNNPFTIKDNKGDRLLLPFSSFFDVQTGQINLGRVHSFMYNLGLDPELIPEIQSVIDKRNEEEGNPEEA